MLRNVSESIGHAFFSALVDDAHGVVWVFGSAHHRGWDNKGPCDDNSKSGGSAAKGCYVGAWSSSDLLHWSQTFKTVMFPDGNYTQNNDATWVRPVYSDWAARHGTALPRHQAAMARPSRPFRVPVFAARTLNAAGQSRVTLALR